MICKRCLRLATRRNASLVFTTSRSITTTKPQAARPVSAEVATASSPPPNTKPPATSTSAAQPFSEALTYSPGRSPDLPIDRNHTKRPVERAPSSVPAGTVLKGLNFMKNKQDPIAGEDAEYPDWLWGVLDKKGGEGVEDGEGIGGGDLYAKSKKQRRIAAKALRKQQLLNPELLQPKIPMYEQSVDLYAGDGSIQGAMRASGERQELTKAMRGKRRKDIKEANFLKGVR